ncbi:MGMT family protein [Patescibacteria group bacterium]
MTKAQDFETIRKIVSQIPEGKVATFGQIAEIVGIKDARLVGYALKGNKSSEVPCHRVVKAGGKLPTNYSMGDWQDDKRKLISESVKFKDDITVDLDKHQWDGNI